MQKTAKELLEKARQYSKKQLVDEVNKVYGEVSGKDYSKYSDIVEEYFKCHENYASGKGVKYKTYREQILEQEAWETSELLKKIFPFIGK